MSGRRRARRRKSMFETIGRAMTSDAQTLKMKCGWCGHEDEWSRQAALAALGADARPDLVCHRLVCGQCYSRRHTAVWI
jgi:uncharacterized Fe-S cluster-containing radical SAM superfamily protein